MSAMRSAAAKIKHAQHMADALAEHHDDPAKTEQVLKDHWEGVARLKATAERVPQLKNAADEKSTGKIWPWW